MSNYDERINFRCPECGRFVSFDMITVIRDGLDTIIRIEGNCKKHGIVDVKNTADWCYEDFFSPEDV